jgi:hypothetical protein
VRASWRAGLQSQGGDDGAHSGRVKRTYAVSNSA